MTSSLVTAGAGRVMGASVTSALAVTTLGRGTVTIVVAVVGLMIGSFLNVVVYRVPRRLSVAHPRSFCPHCDAPLLAVDNIPLVSWVVLGGRCRRCRGPISIRYPLVELATAVVFAAVAWGLGPHWAVAGFCVLAATFIALVAVERDGLAPPLSVAVIGAGMALALLVAAGLADHRHTRVLDAVIGTVVAGALALVARRRTDRTGTNPWTAAVPVLLPAGTALGWLGPAAAGEGLATTVVVLLVAAGARHLRAAGTGDGRSSRGVLGAALVAGVVVATVVAVATGAGAGT